ncbi:hypothetical protein C8F01DRAFT_1242262 [Mycena amicta]|nr:hypothetical protein C8F01DRAFT_1242262 [Mycena amicta]
MSTTTKQLPPIRLVTTGHKPDGTAIFTFDDVVEPYAPFGPAASRFTNFHASPSVPVSNIAPPPEIAKTIPRTEPGGVLFCATEIMPGTSVPMHRTLSVDYAVVMAGEIVLALDSGEEKIVKTGEVMVQRGANHAWHNRTDQICRILFVGVSSEKIVLEDGTVLDAIAPVLPKKP